MHEPVIILPDNNTSSGVHGVCWNKDRNRWVSTIKYKGRVNYLGKYTNKNDAIIARLLAEKKYYGDLAPQYSLFEKYNI